MIPIPSEGETTEQWKARQAREMHMRRFLEVDFIDALPEGLQKQYAALCDQYATETEALWHDYYKKESAAEKAMFKKVYELIRSYEPEGASR